MSSSWSSSRSMRQSNPTRMTDEQINDLVSKLQMLLPQTRSGNNEKKVSSAKVLQETCNYIRSLHQEVDDLSRRLAELLETTDHISNSQAAIVRSLLM